MLAHCFNHAQVRKGIFMASMYYYYILYYGVYYDCHCYYTSTSCVSVRVFVMSVQDFNDQINGRSFRFARQTSARTINQNHTLNS